MAIQKEQLNKVIPASFSAEEILSCLEEDGIIDADSAIDILTNKRRKEILSRHNHPITQGKDGRWRTRIDDDSYADGRRMIARSTKEAVENILIELYSYEGITMETLFPEWIKYKSLHVSHTTIERTIRTWNQYYADSEFVKIPLIKLTKLAVDEWVHKMLKEHPMNKHQYGNFRLIIRQELDYAVDRGIIKQNPFNLINVDLRRALKPEHKKPDHTQVYSRDELDRLCEVAWKDYENRNHPVHQLTPLAVMFMFLTGVRVGEVCGIRYEDIHERTMTIRRMVLHPSGEIIEHTQGFEDREVPLVPKALKLIELARERQSEAGVSTEGFVFSMNDDPILYTSVTKAFTSYCNKIGIEPKSSHKARKTFVSTLLDADMNINSVRQFVGHKDEKTTLNNYCYDRSSEEEKYRKLEQALS